MRKFLIVLLTSALLAPAAHAADSTVSSMTSASALGGTELLYCVQGGADRKCTPAQLATYIEGLMSGDCTWTANVITCTKINGNSVPASAAAHQALICTAASTCTWKTVPDCTDTSGNHLNYTQSTDAFSCGTSVATNVFPGYKAGNWYLPFGPTIGATGSAPANNTTFYCYPFYVPQTVTISDLGVRMSTPGSSNIQIAVYNNDASVPNRAGTLVGATGDIANNGSAGILSTTIAGGNKQLLQNTLYWGCLAANDGTGVYTAYSATSPFMPQMIGSATVGNVINSSTVLLAISYATQTYGTWPDFTGVAGTETLGASARGYMIGFKVVSTP